MSKHLAIINEGNSIRIMVLNRGCNHNCARSMKDVEVHVSAISATVV